MFVTESDRLKQHLLGATAVKNMGTLQLYAEQNADVGVVGDQIVQRGNVKRSRVNQSVCTVRENISLGQRSVQKESRKQE